MSAKSDPQKDETVDEKKMDGLLKKMLSTPPKPHKREGDKVTKKKPKPTK